MVIMSKLHKIAIYTFIIGLIFKLIHVYGAFFLLFTGTLLLLVHSLIFLFKNRKQNLVESFLYLSFSFWTIFFLFTIQLYNYGILKSGYDILHVISIVITIIYFFLYFKTNKTIKKTHYFLIGYFLFATGLSFVQYDKVFYFFNLNDFFDDNNQIEGYHEWDRYSWFLYIENKQKESIEANHYAQRIIDKKLKISNDNEIVIKSEMIKRHGKLILEKNWIDYYK